MRMSLVTLGAVVLTACGEEAVQELVVQTVFRGRDTPVEGIQVQVNDLDWVTTGADGEARFEVVSSPFTVRAYFTTPKGYEDRSFDYVWQVSELDQNPVVLQVVVPWEIPEPLRHASIAGQVDGASGSSETLLQVVAASPAGHLAADVLADGTFEIPSLGWSGPREHTTVLHAFESDTADPPAHYSGYGSTEVTLTDPVDDAEDLVGGALNGVVVELGAVAETHLSGSVGVPTALAERELLGGLAVVFPDLSRIGLIRDSAVPRTPGAFDFTVPLVGDRTAIVGFVAWPPEGRMGPSSQYRAVFEVAEGAPVSGIGADLLEPLSLLEPADGAVYGPDTVFRWSAGPAGVRYTLSASCRQPEGEYNLRYVSWAVETTATEARLPALPFFTLAGATCTWAVYWEDTGSSLLLAPIGGLGFVGRNCVSADRTFSVP